jgi:hypothetical protein
LRGNDPLTRTPLLVEPKAKRASGAAGGARVF